MINNLTEFRQIHFPHYISINLSEDELFPDSCVNNITVTKTIYDQYSQNR
jgi:hypothetical protein